MTVPPAGDRLPEGELTACVLDCGDRCSIRVTRAGSDLRLRGEPSHPFTRGFTCGKIHRYPARLTHPERITHPWMRDSAGRLRPVDWERAMGAASERLTAALTEDPASALLLRGSGSLGESKRYADRLFRALGARLGRGSLCDGAGLAAIEADAGAVRMNHPAELDSARAIVLWGKHPRAGSTHLERQIAEARSRGVRVVGVNPDPSAVADSCDVVIPVRPGRDRYLVRAIMRLYLEEAAEEPVLDGVASKEQFLDFARSADVPALLDAAGVTSEEAHRLARTYLSGTDVATVCGWALQRYDAGGETVRALHALALLAGTLGVPGGGFYYGVSSGRLFEPPPAPQPLGVAAAADGADPPPDLSLPLLARELENAAPAVSFAWVTAHNILNQAPDAGAVRRAFRQIETRVVVDGYWTDTALEATIVLPPALWLEEEDLVGSYWFPVVAAARKVCEPPGSCRSDFAMMKDLEERLGVPSDYPTLDSWLSDRLPREAPTLEELRSRGWWTPEEDPVAWRDGFAHADGRFRPLTALTPSPPEPPAPNRFRLLSLIRREALHSQMLPEEQTEALPARLHPDTAEMAGVASGETAELSNPRGSLEVRVVVDDGLQPGLIIVPRDGWVRLGRGANALTEARVTDIGETAAYYESWVALAPATDEASTAKQRSRRPEES